MCGFAKNLSISRGRGVTHVTVACLNRATARRNVGLRDSILADSLKRRRSSGSPGSPGKVNACADGCARRAGFRPLSIQSPTINYGFSIAMGARAARGVRS